MDKQGLGYVILPRLPFKDSRDETIYDHLFKRAEYRADQDLELGQTIIKLVELAKRFNWSSDQIKYSLDRMVKQEYLKLDRSRKTRLYCYSSELRGLHTAWQLQQEEGPCPGVGRKKGS